MVMRLKIFKEEQVPFSLPWRYKAFTLRRVEQKSMPSIFLMETHPLICLQGLMHQHPVKYPLSSHRATKPSKKTRKHLKKTSNLSEREESLASTSF